MAKAVQDYHTNYLMEEGYPPPRKGVQYHLLEPTNKAIKDRLPIWIRFPVAFCIEAMNWVPYWYQKELLRDESYFIAACWSRQTGKSETIAHIALHTAFTKTQADVLIVAPGRRQAAELYAKVIHALERSPLIRSSVKGKPTKEQTEFLNGSRIINLPAGDSGDTIRGYSISLLILEEMAFIPERVKIAVEQGLTSAAGKEIVISTPQGRNNAFYRIYFPTPNTGYDMSKMGRQQIGDWSCYRYDYTVGINVFKPDGSPQLSPMHINKFRRELPEWRFKTEYGAEFIEDIDAYFSQSTIDECFNSKFEMLEQPLPNRNYFMGIDIAKGGDLTAVSIAERIDYDPKTFKELRNPHVQIVHREIWKIGRIDTQYPLILALVSRWNPKMIFFDETAMGARPFEELQTTYHLPIEGITFSGATKVKMYGTLMLLMSDKGEIDGWSRRFQSYYDAVSIIQYQSMVYEIPKILSKKTGVEHDGPGFKIYAARGHDDIPDADALVCMCVGQVNTDSIFVSKVTKSYYRSEEEREMISQEQYKNAIRGNPTELDDVPNSFHAGGTSLKTAKNISKRLNPYRKKYNF